MNKLIKLLFVESSPSYQPNIPIVFRDLSQWVKTQLKNLKSMVIKFGVLDTLAVLIKKMMMEKIWSKKKSKQDK